MFQRAMIPMLIICGCLILMSLVAITPSSAAPPTGQPVQTVLDPAQLSSTGSGDYLSPITSATPFTHMLLRWEVVQPAQSSLQLEVRASMDAVNWTPWGSVGEDDDLRQPADGPNLHWSTIIYAGEGMRFWQVRATLSAAPDGSLPTLGQIAVNTVDARYGPSAPTPDADLDAIGKPAVVSRTSWGSPDGQSSRATPAYYNVTHLVIHHTADANSLGSSERSWADRVRAIWSFHAITRGWGDIGYNFLIDPNGLIYEGRAGGDNAVGFHDTANYGSMGVSVMGIYSSVAPSAAAQSSLVNLLAWKADQRSIDPQASAYYYGCAHSDYCAPFNAGGVVPTISGHRQVTPGRTTCPGDSFQALIPNIRLQVQNRLNVPAPITSMELLNVQYDRTTVVAGELLKMTFTVRNNGNQTIMTQAPQAGSNFNLADSYVYDEDECFLGDAAQSYPAYPKESNRFRVTLGVVESARAPACNGESGGYPWRWGLNGDLAPGQTRQVVGYVRFREPGTVTLRAGAINEYVSYMARDVFSQSITVIGERSAPMLNSYTTNLNPIANVYRLGNVPNNFLARTQNAISISKGEWLGSFVWDGTPTDWGYSGPIAGVNDNFVIEQTRVFIAPVAGNYTFQTSSDDGSWLWVDGVQVVLNSGLHATESREGTIYLAAGRHVLSFKYFERDGGAFAGYRIKLPGSSVFAGLIEGLGGSGTQSDSPLGTVFPQLRGITLVADDFGGSGVSKLRISFDGVQWIEFAGRSASLGQLVDGRYTIYYRAVDAQQNESATQMLTLNVDSRMPIWRTYLPMVVSP